MRVLMTFGLRTPRSESVESPLMDWSTMVPVLKNCAMGSRRITISDRSSSGSVWISLPVHPLLTMTRYEVTLYCAHRRSVAAQTSSAVAPPSQTAHPLIPDLNSTQADRECRLPS